MLAEHPIPQPIAEAVDASLDAPMDVVVLVVPDHGPRRGLSADFLEAIAEMRARGDAAVLVVFPRAVDPEVIARAEGAGASHCVVAPTSADLFRHIERARALRRHAAVAVATIPSTACGGHVRITTDDQPPSASARPLGNLDRDGGAVPLRPRHLPRDGAVRGARLRRVPASRRRLRGRESAPTRSSSSERVPARRSAGSSPGTRRPRRSASTRATACSRRPARSCPAADLRVARLQDPLPAGPFDLVFSALAVHHLDPTEKATLFREVAARLQPGRPLRPRRCRRSRRSRRRRDPARRGLRHAESRARSGAVARRRGTRRPRSAGPGATSRSSSPTVEPGARSGGRRGAARISPPTVGPGRAAPRGVIAARRPGPTTQLMHTRNARSGTHQAINQRIPAPQRLPLPPTVANSPSVFKRGSRNRPEVTVPPALAGGGPGEESPSRAFETGVRAR